MELLPWVVVGASVVVGGWVVVDAEVVAGAHIPEDYFMIGWIYFGIYVYANFNV